MYTPCIKFIDSDSNVFQVRQIANKIMVTSVPCGYDIAVRNMPTFYPFHAKGERLAVEVATTGVAVWNGAATQIPTPAKTGEQMQVVSTGAQDFGVAMYSGVATGGSSTTIEDSSANFTSLTLASNDHVINLSNGTTSAITSVDSDTQLTVEGFETEDGPIPTSSGHHYRILDKSAGGTGVQVVLTHGIDTDGLPTRHIALTSGLTPVNIGTASTIFVNDFHAAETGTGAAAAGIITCYKQGAASTVYARINAGTNSALQARKMVPATHNLYITGWSASCTAGKPVAIRLVANSHEGVKYDGHFQVIDSVFLESSANCFRYEVPKKFSPLSIVGIMAYAIQAGANIAASFEGFLKPI